MPRKSSSSVGSNEPIKPTVTHGQSETQVQEESHGPRRPLGTGRDETVARTLLVYRLERQMSVVHGAQREAHDETSVQVRSWRRNLGACPSIAVYRHQRI